MNVLVGTSVWSLALRRKTASLNATEKFIVAELSEIVREGRARLIGLVRQELLSGIKTTEQFEKLRLHLRSFPDEPIDTADHEEAAKAGTSDMRETLEGFGDGQHFRVVCKIRVSRKDCPLAFDRYRTKKDIYRNHDPLPPVPIRPIRFWKGAENGS
jgi:hypothetical protein